MDFKTPVVAVDIVIFTVTSEKRDTATKSLPNRQLKVLLIKRGDDETDPYRNKWSLPGGFAKIGETLLQTAQRKLKEKANIEYVHIEHFDNYSEPNRDKRGWVISSAYFALVNEELLKNRKALSSTQDIGIFTLEEIDSMDLAFDHKQIIMDGKKEIETKLHTTSIAKEFLPEEFTLAELAQVISVIDSNTNYSELKENFDRKMTRTKKRNVIEPALDHNQKHKTTNRHSQAYTKMYRFREDITNTSIYK